MTNAQVNAERSTDGSVVVRRNGADVRRMRAKSTWTDFDELQWIRSRAKLDTQVSDEPMKDHPYIYASIHAIAQNLSQVPWVTRLVHDEEGENLDTKVQSVFDDPHPMLSTVDFFYLILVWLMHSGECIVVKEGRDGRVKSFGEEPAELWPLNGRLFKRVINEDTKLIQYWVLNEGTNEEVVYLPHEIIQLRLPNPYDFYCGLAPLDAAKLPLQSDWSARKYNEDFFENNADPGGILYTDQKIYAGQDDEILQKFEDRHQGAGKRERTAVLDRGLKYQPSAATHRDMQFSEQQSWNRGEIMTVFRTPPSVMGVYEDVNYATADEERKGFWTDVLVPYMKLLRDGFWSGLYQWVDFGRTVGVFDTNDIVYLQEDLDKKLDQAERLHGLGYTQEQALSRVGLEADNEWQTQSWTTPSVVPWEDLLYASSMTMDEDLQRQDIQSALADGRTPDAPTDTGTAPAGSPPADAEPTAVPLGTKPPEAAGAGAGVTDVQQTAFNGAQVSAAKDVVQQVALGELPADSAIQMLQSFFFLDIETARAMVEPAAVFVPASQEPEAAVPVDEVLPPVEASGEPAIAKDEVLDKVEVDHDSLETPSGLEPLVYPGLTNLETESDRDVYWKALYTDLLAPQELKFQTTMRRYFFDLRKEQMQRIADAVERALSATVKRAMSVNPDIKVLDACAQIKAVEAFGAPPVGLKEWLDDTTIDKEQVTKGVKDFLRKVGEVLFDTDKWKKRIAAITRPRYKETTKKAQNRFAREIEDATGTPAKEAKATGLVDALADDISVVNETVRHQLQSQIAEGVQENETIGEVARRIRAVFNVSNSRATTIARTEVGAASERARDLMNEEMGFTTVKWLSARDSHVRTPPESEFNHRIDGEIVDRAKGETFSNGLRFPHDPDGEPGNVINCRCTTVPVLGEFTL